MLKVNSVLFQNNALRWLVWLAVILALIATFLGYFNRNQEKMMRTKAVIVGKTMQQRVNQLHQLWLLNRQPDRLEVDGKMVEFDSAGWVNLSNDGQMNCNYLLTVLYPDNNEGKFQLVTKRQNLATNSYVCLYEMGAIAEIKVYKIKSLNIKIIM